MASNLSASLLQDRLALLEKMTLQQAGRQASSSTAVCGFQSILDFLEVVRPEWHGSGTYWCNSF
jgi:hypothetical protein